MKLLVTGFEPFAGLPHNPSAALLSRLPERLGGLEVAKAVLPVDTRRAPAVLSEVYQRIKPGAVINLGLAVTRSVLSLERVALNVLDFEIPDNSGHAPRDREVLEGSPLALPSRLPLRAIQAAWQSRGIPGTLSNSAGTYLCNQVMYLSLAWLPPEVPAGFIHLPADETLALHRPQPYVPLETQARAVAGALEVVVEAMTVDG